MLGLPDVERPRRRSNVCYFSMVPVIVLIACYRVDVRPQEEEVYDHVDDLSKQPL